MNSSDFSSKMDIAFKGQAKKPSDCIEIVDFRMVLLHDNPDTKACEINDGEFPLDETVAELTFTLINPNRREIDV
jgi:hypothetical protein